MTRSSQASLQREWGAARAGRGGLVLIAGAEDARVAGVVASLVAAATRDGARVRRIADAPQGDAGALAAPEGFEAAAELAARLRRESELAPQLVLLERIERASEPAIRLLAVLGRELRDAAVLVVATRGAERAASDPARERALADLARAGRWISIEAPRADPPRAARAAVPTFSIARDGSHWTIARGDRRVVLRDSRGLRLLAKLAAEPGRAWRAVDLVERSDEADAGDALDASARAAYRRELASLRDAPRADAAARRDAAFLARALARDTGLGGRARKLDSAADRARVAVKQNLRRAIAAVRAQDAELARWLAASLRTGHECRFDPDD